jgi:hypothetical protein
MPLLYETEKQHIVRGVLSSGWARLRAVLPERAALAAIGRTPRQDLQAGFTVAIVALPLSLGFGISSGMGAEAGLATAVVAGSLAAVFGGSALQVSGTSGAMTVMLMPIMSTHGATGVLTVGVLAGLLLIGLALARGGRYITLVPAPVVAGFTVGIGDRPARPGGPGVRHDHGSHHRRPRPPPQHRRPAAPGELTRIRAGGPSGSRRGPYGLA